MRNGVTTKYVYDAAGNLLAEADSSGAITQYYIHGAGLIALKPQGDSVYCYHFDATGNTVALTDQSGSIANTYAYKPFGEMTQGQTQTITQPFTYVGQYGVMAEPYGYYYMRARYYDSGSGRFVSEDPLGFGGGDVNLYAYVTGNPVNAIDPSGQIIFALAAPAVYTGMMMAADAAVIGAAGWMMSKGDLSPGFWNGPEGAGEWGRRNGVDVHEAKDKFHRKKHKADGRPKDKFGVNPDTGDISNPDGEIVDNMSHRVSTWK